MSEQPWTVPSEDGDVPPQADVALMEAMPAQGISPYKNDDLPVDEGTDTDGQVK